MVVSKGEGGKEEDSTWGRHRDKTQGISNLTKIIPISSAVVSGLYLQKQTLKQILKCEKSLEVIPASTHS